MSKKVETNKGPFVKVVKVGESKNGSNYLYITTKAGERVFINLIKDNKKFVPNNLEKYSELEVEYRSYKKGDNETKSMTLFDVNILAFIK